MSQMSVSFAIHEHDQCNAALRALPLHMLDISRQHIFFYFVNCSQGLKCVDEVLSIGRRFRFSFITQPKAGIPKKKQSLPDSR